MRHGGLGFIALFWSAAAAAQPGPAPVPIESGREVTGSSATAGAGGLVGCYAIATRPGAPLTVTLQPSRFDGELGIGTGGDCATATAAQTRTWSGNAPVTVTVPATADRHLILVRRSMGALGTFRLVARHGPAGAATASGFAPAPPPASTGQVTGSGFAPPSGNVQSVQRQMMLDQLARGEVRTVGAEDIRRQAEAEAAAAERRAQEEQMAAAAPSPQVDIAGAFRQGFNQTMRQAEESARQVEATNRQIRAMAAEEEARRARERARVAEAQARAQQRQQQQRLAQQQALAAEQRMAEARRQQQAAAAQQRAAEQQQAQAAAGRASTQGRPAPGEPEVEVIAMLEGVVVCPLNPDRAGLFGASACHGPFTNVFARPDEVHNMARACNATTARDLGTYGQHRVWGCGYGINPRRSGSPNLDQAARYGLIIPSRRTFRCRADIVGYCRN